MAAAAPQPWRRRLLPRLALAMVAAGGAGVAAASTELEDEAVCPVGGCGRGAARGRAHYWPHVRGISGSYGISQVVAPRDLSNPSWRWHHPDGQYGTVVVGGPVIDEEKNLYIVEQRGIHKFSPDGELRWTVHSETEGGLFPDGPGIVDGSLFATTMQGHLGSYDLETGARKWQRRYYNTTGGDSKYVTGHDGIVVIGSDAANGGGGSKHVLGVNATTGDLMWEFAPDTPTWNNCGMFTDDDTVVFQDWDAKVYCLGLHNGSLLWKAGGSGGETWTDGGTIIGANGVVYAASAKGGMAVKPFSGGGVHAYRLSDGKLLWEKNLTHPIYTWPVVGKLQGEAGGFSVIVCTGAMPGVPMPVVVTVFARVVMPGMFALSLVWTLCCCCRGGLGRAAKRFCSCLAIGAALFMAIYLGYKHFWGPFPSEIIAFDADTGEMQWRRELPTWYQTSSRGDAEGYEQRAQHLPSRPICLPATFSSPSVDGNGVVIVGHMSGLTYSLKDWNKDGVIDDSEVSTFDAESAFLHSGPAFAPGMFAFTTCDSLFVWRTE